MIRGLKLFWSALCWWEKMLVIVLLPLVIAVSIFLAIVSRGTPRQDRDVEDQIDGYMKRLKKKDKERQEDLEALDDEITTIHEKKAVIDKEKDNAVKTISECNSIDCVDRVLLQDRERRRSRRGSD